MLSVRLPLRRINSLDDAVQITPQSNVELFLWLVDVHDLADTASAEIKLTLSVRLQSLIYSINMDKQIPGKMPEFTHLTLAFVVYLKLQPPPADICLDFAKTHRLWAGSSTLSQLLTSLDAVSLQWGKIPDSEDLQTYLHFLFCAAAGMILQVQNSTVLDVDSLRYECGDLYRVHPMVLKLLACRFCAFVREPTEVRVVRPNLFKRWLQKKKASMSVRTFRADVLNVQWEHLLGPGDAMIVKGTPLKVLQSRVPSAFISKWRSNILYGNVDELLDLDAWGLHQVGMVMLSHGLDWIKHCYCKKVWAHKSRFHRIPVPIVTRKCGHFQTYFLGLALGPSGSFGAAFHDWAQCLRDNCKSKCYGVNLSNFLAKFLDTPLPPKTLAGVVEFPL
ncbi:hypothetical protein OAU26_03765 [Mariniblastus sp.]|jgi:hypothetical protein|nr:hypothetical protein [Mariniblastus sp.]